MELALQLAAKLFQQRPIQRLNIMLKKKKEKMNKAELEK